jgi:hypothetical protein
MILTVQPGQSKRAPPRVVLCFLCSPPPATACVGDSPGLPSPQAEIFETPGAVRDGRNEGRSLA